MNGFFTSLITIFTLLLPISSFAQRVSPSDFDSDGLSDFVLINANSNVLSWSAVKPDGSSQQDLGQFGRLGHQIALGDYLGLSIPQPATVAESKGKLVWRIFHNGASTAKEFGLTGETALAGGDFNGDGILDATVVESSGKKLIWKIHPSLFTNSSATPLQVTFGQSKDPFLFSNPDGKGDRLTTVTSKSRSFLLRYYTVDKSATSRKLVELTVPAGQLKNRPLPLSIPAGKDGLLFYQKRSGVTRFSLYRPDQKKLTSFRIKASGDVLVGNFSSERGEEVAVQSASGFLVYNPFAKKLTSIAAPTGIAVDEVNINRVGKLPSNDDGNNGGGDDNTPPPTGNEPPPEGIRAVCQQYSGIAMGEMLIKSEISDHIPGMDPRATGYTVVCARLCPKNQSRADFFYSNGTYAGSVAYYGTFHGNGKPRLYGAVGQAPQHFADQIAAKAQTIGNGKLYMQMSAARSGAGTECKEFNPTGRNGGLY